MQRFRCLTDSSSHVYWIKFQFSVTARSRYRQHSDPLQFRFFSSQHRLRWIQICMRIETFVSGDAITTWNYYVKVSQTFDWATSRWKIWRHHRLLYQTQLLCCDKITRSIRQSNTEFSRVRRKRKWLWFVQLVMTNICEKKYSIRWLWIIW